MLFRSALTGVALALSIPATVRAEDPPAVSYYKDVRPIFQQHCQGCHQPAKPQRRLRDDRPRRPAQGRRARQGRRRRRASRTESYLVEQITVPDNGKAEMPKGRDPLNVDPDQADRATGSRRGRRTTRPPARRPSRSMPRTRRSTRPRRSSPRSPSRPTASSSPSPATTKCCSTAQGLRAPFAADRPVGARPVARVLAGRQEARGRRRCAGPVRRGAGLGRGEGEAPRSRSRSRSTRSTALSWSPDGKTIAFGCADNTVRAIDAATGKQTLQMGTHTDWVLGTAFAQDGLHLVSVGRDMSMKLTEVATQRFVDNVTSITPGALKGGLMAVDRRPVEEFRTVRFLGAEAKVTKPKRMQKVPADTPGVPPKLYDELIVGGVRRHAAALQDAPRGEARDRRRLEPGPRVRADAGPRLGRRVQPGRHAVRRRQQPRRQGRGARVRHEHRRRR